MLEYRLIYPVNCTSMKLIMRTNVMLRVMLILIQARCKKIVNTIGRLTLKDAEAKFIF